MECNIRSFRGGLAIVEIRQMPRGFFWECEALFKNAWHFKVIFREFKAFSKISILSEDIFREIEVFFSINQRVFQRLQGF
jgi:hypothetical protein